MSTLIDYIKQELNNTKLRKALSEVVENVDALIPQNEGEFADLQKFGLYPAEECVPFVTEDGTPFYTLDNMATKLTLVLIFLACCNVLGKLLAQLRENRGHLHYALPEDMHLFGKPIINL